MGNVIPYVIQILLWGGILVYGAYVVRRRVRKIKKGEFCDCCEGGCAGCPGKKD